jgi:DNA-binding response OmpR family regulator
MSPTHILLAEDDPDYAFLVQLALREAGVINPVHVVSSREETFAYEGRGVYSDSSKYPFPAVILLGLRLPLFHDFDVLRWIRQHQDFNVCRVVVLSGVEYEEEAPFRPGARRRLLPSETFRL